MSGEYAWPIFRGGGRSLSAPLDTLPLAILTNYTSSIDKSTSLHYKVISISLQLISATWYDIATQTTALSTLNCTM